MASRSDQVPLLDCQGLAHEEHPDTRFAIEDETGTYEEEHQQQEQRGSTTARGDEGEDERHKYPPAAPPPSYREATGKSALAVQMARLCSHFSAPSPSSVFNGILKMWSFTMRIWPSNRFAQMGIFIAGLWVLVVVSGPSFETTGPRSGGGNPWLGMEQLTESGPGPISGDGHVLHYANWTLNSCQSSKAHHNEVVCISSTRIELDTPHNFHSTESVFLYADPPRQNQLSAGRGHVPGTIEVKVVEEGTEPHQSPKGKVSVLISAEFEQSRIEVFERSTVAWMLSGINTQGVGIYTYPMPLHYRHRDPPPLFMRIQILIPAGARLPALVVQASAMSIGGFVDPPVFHPDKARRDALALPVEQALQPFQSRDAPPALSPPYFGRFVLQTAITPIHVAAHFPVTALGIVKLTTYNGDINVEGDINSAEVRLESMTGSIRLQENAHVMAWRESRVVTQTGNIELKRNSWLDSASIVAKTDNGNILGGGKDVRTNGDGGVWKSNMTIDMKTQNGAIHASYAVRMPTELFVNPTKNVRVEVESQNGGIDVAIVEHQQGTALRGKIGATVGAVSAHIHPSYEGPWQLEGSNAGSAVTPPSDANRHFQSTERKKGVIRLLESGTIGAQDGPAAKDSTMEVRSSLGSAKLIFD